MKFSLPILVLPLVAAGVAGWTITMADWEMLRTPILPAISVIAAAVLVRLARGLPFSNPDHFTLGQFRSVARKLEDNARKLRALIYVCLAVITLLIACPSVVAHLPKLVGTQDWLVNWLERAISALIGYCSVYSFARVIGVIQSDVALLRLQTKTIEAVIASKSAENFEKALATTEQRQIVGSGGFGRKLI